MTEDFGGLRKGRDIKSHGFCNPNDDHVLQHIEGSISFRLLWPPLDPFGGTVAM